MKYLATLSFLLIFFTGVTFAQDKTAAELKNEGNEALRSKNYKQALTLYEQAIDVWAEGEEMDAAMIYNTANCARKLKNFDKALKYYTQSKELNYKSDISTYYIAYSLKNQDKEEEMEKVLMKGLEEFPTSKYIKHMKKMLVTYYLKLGSEPYNAAGQILGTAATADPSQYDAITAKANAKFEEAKPFFAKALEVDPTNENAKQSLAEINDRLSGKK
ncbi:tetratricopeptide repeat protein [Marinilabiliaceae bacterium JC017]|nr:tetratricopeptide repeat protein [Marinilabiliaceae bacterium JC017]